ncbi:PleD family two-component response regulator [Breoghania corrubedonensis]|uniref:PleD family two-component response regulator n=1 Tax=Breoghania corrubedonensis TaxID=665038 RepID=A0A2T5VB94_9HYPH|nr:hypothetical protein [Breoghania corrubedonensis]PTW61023.1 PleD family two-component response regulator [Breoghania corrubedonensis]
MKVDRKMPLTGTVAALCEPGRGNDEFWDDLGHMIGRLHRFTRPEQLNELLQSDGAVEAVVVDGLGMPIEDFVRLAHATERVLGDKDIPLVCLAAGPFHGAETLRPDAILTHPIPPVAVASQIHSLIRLNTRKREAGVRIDTLKQLGNDVPRPSMSVSGGQADNRPSLLVVGTRGNFAQIESVLGVKIQLVAALSADMANLYLSWKFFDAVVLDQENADAIDTLMLLRNNPVHHDLPVILLTEGLDKETAEEAYRSQANDVLTLRSTQADLFLRLTTSIRARRLDRQTQEMLLRSQDALEGANGAISAKSFRFYLHNAKNAAHHQNKPLTVMRLSIEPVCEPLTETQALQVDRPALRLIRRLVRMEDLAVIVEGTGIVTVFPDTDKASAELSLARIRGVLRNTQVTLEIGASPLRLDASAKIAEVHTAA